MFHRVPLLRPRVALAAALLALAAPLAQAWAGSARPEAASKEVAPLVLFAGFAKSEGGAAHIYVRMTKAAVVREDAVDGGKRVFHLLEARLSAPNNQNPLLTDYFGTLVSSVALHPEKEGVRLVIELAEGAGESRAEHRVVESGDLATLYVDLSPAPRGGE